MYSDLCSFSYHNEGHKIRSNGPQKIVFDKIKNITTLIFKGCQWMTDQVHKDNQFTLSDIMEMIKPDHEWQESTCGKGNCRQWNHNPQRYLKNLFHQPPKCMFTQKLLEGGSWRWSWGKFDWCLTLSEYHEELSLTYLKNNYVNGGNLICCGSNSPHDYKFEY